MGRALSWEWESFEFVVPRKGALDPHPQRMDRFVEEALPSTLRALAVPRLLGDVGDQAGIEDALPIAGRIKAAIEVKVSTSEVQAHLFGHLFQRSQALW